MRKKENEITKKSIIETVIQKAAVCRLGLSDGNMPYVVPVCFGYRNNVLFIHSALRGMKIDIIRRNKNVCFEVDINTEIVKAENGCNWGVNYQSVIGFGKASFVEDIDEKREALCLIMSHYSDKVFEFPDEVIKRTAIIKIEIETVTGKQAGC